MTDDKDATPAKPQTERRILEGAEALRKSQEPNKAPLKPLSQSTLDQIATSFGLAGENEPKEPAKK